MLALIGEAGELRNVHPRLDLRVVVQELGAWLRIVFCIMECQLNPGNQYEVVLD